MLREIKKVSDEGYKLIDDWHDFDKSLLSRISEQYYKAQGIKAYNTKIVNYIPFEVSNCFPHAFSLAKIAEKIAEEKDKVKILDLGCGSAIFARHLLIALKELDLIDKVELILADYSKKLLEDIKSSKILDGFKNYTLVEMDALDPSSAKTLNGKKFELKDLDLVTMNYLYDALPAKILKPNKHKKLEKLQFRFLQDDDGSELQKLDDKTICEDLNIINKLLIDTQWVEYKPKDASEIEQEYFDFVKNEPVNPLGEVIYSYGVLKVTEAMLDLLSDEGVIYAADMPNRFDSQGSFRVYGNSTANDINEALVINTFIKKGFEVFFHRDANLNHYFFAKNKAAMIRQEKAINENFVMNSVTDVFLDHKQAINSINSPYSRDLFRMILTELKKMDTHSCLSKVAQGQDCMNFGENKNAKELFLEAKSIDFLEEYNLDDRIKSLS